MNERYRLRARHRGNPGLLPDFTRERNPCIARSRRTSAERPLEPVSPVTRDPGSRLRSANRTGHPGRCSFPTCARHGCILRAQRCRARPAWRGACPAGDDRTGRALPRAGTSAQPCPTRLNGDDRRMATHGCRFRQRVASPGCPEREKSGILVHAALRCQMTEAAPPRPEIASRYHSDGNGCAEDAAESDPERASRDLVVLPQPVCRIRPGMRPGLPAVSDVGEAGKFLGLPRQETACDSGCSCRNPCRLRGTSSRRDRSEASVGPHRVAIADVSATDSACSGALSLTLPTE